MVEGVALRSLWGVTAILKGEPLGYRFSLYLTSKSL